MKKEDKKREVCSRCSRPRKTNCVCTLLLQDKISLHVCSFVILQHYKEAQNNVNSSVPLIPAVLSPASCQVIVGDRFNLDSILDSTETPGASIVVLYPGDGSVALEDYVVDTKVKMIVLDGTWPQTRKMWKLNPHLTKLIDDGKIKKVHLRSAGAVDRGIGGFQFRKEPVSGYVSTLEVITRAIELIEPESVAPIYLLQAFNSLVSTQLKFIEAGRNRKLCKRLVRDETDNICVSLESTSLNNDRKNTELNNKRNYVICQESVTLDGKRKFNILYPVITNSTYKEACDIMNKLKSEGIITGKGISILRRDSSLLNDTSRTKV